LGLPLIAALCWFLPMQSGAASAGPTTQLTADQEVDSSTTTVPPTSTPRLTGTTEERALDDREDDKGDGDHGDDDHGEGDGDGDHGDDHGDGDHHDDGDKGDHHGDGHHGDDKRGPERRPAPTTTRPHVRSKHSGTTPKVKATDAPRSTDRTGSRTTTPQSVIPPITNPPITNPPTTAAATSTTEVVAFTVPPTTEPLAPVPVFPSEPQNFFQRIPVWLPVTLLLGATAGIAMLFNVATSTGLASKE
jgi:hypothetical protein